MNRHFEDARYYLRRAAQQVTAGIRAELVPVEGRIRDLTGREADPEPSRVERIRERLGRDRRRET